MNPAEYLAELQAGFVASPAVESFTIVDERTLPDSGYLRVRLQLSNGDYLELAEYFTFDGKACYTTAYRYQWMDSTQTHLRRRWDNVAHFPHLPNHPHHVHIGNEANVHPGEPLNSLDVLSLIERELANR
jgi:hypothetical protein